MRIDRLTLGALLLGAVLGMAVLAERLSPQDPIAQDRNLAMSPPGRFHPFGTDRLGRDVLSRVVHGGRVALLASVPGSLLAALIALLAVRKSAAAQGRWRSLADGAIERLGLIPSPALALIGAQFFRCDTPGGLALMLGLTTWGPLARGARTLSSAPPDSRGGFSWTAASLIEVEAFRRIGLLLLLESGLSFLGLGIAPPTPSWGTMIREWMQGPANVWWAGVFPAAALVLGVVAFRMTGDALRPPSLFSRHE